VPRENVLFVDRVGYDRYRDDEGKPALDPARFAVHLVTPPPLWAQARPGEASELSALEMDEGYLTDLAVAAHRDRPLSRLLVFTERLLLWGGCTRDLLAVPGPGAAEILPFRDKAVMKRRAAAAGLPMCRWTPACWPGQLDEAVALLRETGRVVVKPLDGTGSVGIGDCRTEAELAAAIAAASGPATRPVLVEEYVPDEMLHIDALVRDGKIRASTTSRYLVPTTAFTEGKPVPSVTVDDPHVRELAIDHLVRCADAFGVRDSVLHLEVFHRPDDHRMLFSELACRNGGVGVPAVFRALTGVQLYRAMVQAALGEPPDEPPSVPRPRAAGWITIYAGDGIVESISEPPDLIPGLVERRCSVRIGEPASPAGLVGAAALVYVVAGASEQEVTSQLHRIAAETSVVVRPAVPARSAS
jgi:hypothetical protein